MGQPRSKKYNDVTHIYESGMSIQECADFYGVSRQAMYKILYRRNCIFRDRIKKGENNHFFRGGAEGNSKKRRVQQLVSNAIKKGVLVNPKRCEFCDSESTFKDGRAGVQAHHCDYNKPLEVMWLCQKCHHEWHKNNKAINEYESL